MKNLFNKSDYEEIMRRIENLKPGAKAEWGKMNVQQMLKHCSKAMETATGEKKLPRMFIGRILGSMIKKTFVNETPFKKHSPTASFLVTTEELDFETEKADLKARITRFHEGGPEKCTTHPHTFFGKFSPEGWARGMYKHLDHHLRQFSV